MALGALGTHDSGPFLAAVELNDSSHRKLEGKGTRRIRRGGVCYGEIAAHSRSGAAGLYRG